MTKSTIFIFSALAFIIGVLLGSVTFVEKPWLIGAAVFCIAVFALTAAWFRLAAFCLLLLVFGCWRVTEARLIPSEFAGMVGTSIEIEGEIVEDIDVRTDKQLLTVRPDGFSQNMLITVTTYGYYAYGDRVWVRGKLAEPTNFDNFDYRGYLERFNVYALMRYPKVIVLKSEQGNFFKHAILDMKVWGTRTITRLLPATEGQLLLGLLIGAKKALPQEVTDNFATTGTSHIVAISGFNISIIIGALAFLARFLGRSLSLWLSVLFIAGFVVLAGAGASVVRAAAMGVLLLVSFSIGRLYALTPSLLFAAGVMLLINPKILFWDLSFQLSFAATVGIVYGLPVLETLTKKIPGDWGIKNLVLVTVVASLATLPFVLLNFERMSVVAVLANVLIVPVIPLVMFLGAGVLIPFIGAGFAFVAGALLSYMLWVTAKLASWPFASVSIAISLPTFLSLIGALVCTYILLYAYVYKDTEKLEEINVRF